MPSATILGGPSVLGDGFRRELAAFVRSLATGFDPPLPIEDANEAVRLTLAAKRSVERGAPVGPRRQSCERGRGVKILKGPRSGRRELGRPRGNPERYQRGILEDDSAEGRDFANTHDKSVEATDELLEVVECVLAGPRTCDNLSRTNGGRGRAQCL